jgi:hypothetical protein
MDSNRIGATAGELVGEEGVGGVEEYEATSLVMGDAFEHHVTAVGDAGDLTSAAEDGDKVGGAIGDDHFERWSARARNGADALHLAADAELLACFAAGDLLTRKRFKSALQPRSVECFYRRAEPLECVT